jgi:hypothetical protein
MAQKKQNNDRWEPAFTATCSNTLVGATGVVTLTPRWFYTGILAIPTVLVRYLYGTCTVLSFIPVFWPYRRYLYGTCTVLIRHLDGTYTVLVRYTALAPNRASKCPRGNFFLSTWPQSCEQASTWQPALACLLDKHRLVACLINTRVLFA